MVVACIKAHIYSPYGGVAMNTRVFVLVLLGMSILSLIASIDAYGQEVIRGREHPYQGSTAPRRLIKDILIVRIDTGYKVDFFDIANGFHDKTAQTRWPIRTRAINIYLQQNYIQDIHYLNENGGLLKTWLDFTLKPHSDTVGAT